MLPEEFEITIGIQDYTDSSYYNCVVNCPLAVAVRRILGIDNVKCGTEDIFITDNNGKETHYSMCDAYTEEAYLFTKRHNTVFKTIAYIGNSIF